MNKEKKSRHLARIRKLPRRGGEHRDVELSNQFKPAFWSDADSRIAIVRIIRKRVALLMEHAGGDESYQRELLCQRAVFIAVRLETLEVEAAEGKEGFDWGGYVQACNALCGLLARLGLERRVKQAGGLTQYLKERNGDHK